MISGLHFVTQCVTFCLSMIIRRLVWDEWNVEHIARHGVTAVEVEQVCLGDRYIVRESYKDRIMLIGSTFKERILTVVIAPKGNDAYYVITARSADRKERRVHQMEKGGGIK